MNKIETLKPGELLIEGQEAEMVSFFMSAGYRSASGVYTLLFGVEEQEWLDFKASVPPGATVHNRFYWTYDNDETIEEEKAEAAQTDAAPPSSPAPKKKAEPKGPHSSFWQSMFKRGFMSSPELQAVLENEHDGYEFERPEAKELLRKAFSAESLSDVSPDDFREWLLGHQEAHGLSVDGLLLMTEQAERQVIS